jgi:AcrR family transcriptional regulator
MAARTRAAHRPRPSLDREVILDAAARLARVPDPRALSIRRLGEELGADPTAVYRHFRGREALLLALMDRLIGEVVRAVPTRAPWRRRLLEVAVHYVEAMEAHPVVGVLSGHRTTAGPGEREAIELLLGGLVDAGLSPARVTRHYALFSGYLLGMAGIVAASRLEQAARDGDAAWVGAIPDDDAHPLTARFRGRLTAMDDHTVFRTGLEAILDGVARDAAARRGR